jgi:hypothetical protein
VAQRTSRVSVVVYLAALRLKIKAEKVSIVAIGDSWDTDRQRS